MKSLTIFIFFILIAITPAQDFRQFYWGDSKEKIISLEKDGLFIPLENSRDVIGFTGVSVANKKWTLIYFFIDGKLIAGGYSKEYTLSDYDEMKRLLTKKYGEPTDKIWLDGKTMIHLIKGEELTISYIDKTRLNEFLEMNKEEDDLEGL